MISITELQLYTKPMTMEHIRSLAFNRTASSIGETEAINYIEKQLTDNSINSEIEHFNWMGPLKILMRTTYALILVFLIVFRLFLIIITYFILKNMFERFRRISLISQDVSKNLCAHISAKKSMPNQPIVIISAHYDSISANLPYKFQVLIFFLYRLVAIFYALIIILLSIIVLLDFLAIIPISNFMVFLIIFTSIGGVFISVPILYLVFAERPSSGSIDNASGVAISIELAKLLKKNPLENINLLFLWTGAEEWGLKGSIHFCRNHFLNLTKKYDFHRSFNINIDMVGTYIGLLDRTGLFKRKLNENLNDVLEATAKQLNIPIVKYNKIIKPQSDYKIFKRFGKRARTKFQVSCFHSSKDSKYIHSKSDTPDKCSTENLNGCLNICYQTLRSIDQRIEHI